MVVEKPSVPVSAASIKVSAATIQTATISTPRKGIVITELGNFTTTTISSQPLQAKVQDKGKEKMIEPAALPLEEERSNQEKDEANVALTKEWDDIQAKVDANLVEGSSKRAGYELEQEVTKKQKVDDVQETAKVDDDQEATKIKELMEIVPDEEVAIDAIPLATKPPTIVD
ncbi:hypothetical protein Tco_0232673 [Tanacetum coccineum]